MHSRIVLLCTVLWVVLYIKASASLAGVTVIPALPQCQKSTVLYTSQHCTVLYCTQPATHGVEGHHHNVQPGCTTQCHSCILLYTTPYSTVYLLSVTVLYCTVLYCTLLYCTVLYCILLYCTTVLYCTVLYCTVLYLYCTTVLYCTVLYCTVLYCYCTTHGVGGTMTTSSLADATLKRSEVLQEHIPQVPPRGLGRCTRERREGKG